MKHIITLAAVIAATPAMAENFAQHKAHEHGVGELNIAIAGNQLAMELTAPGADIVGFEYTATSAEDKQAIEDALAQLQQPLSLINLPVSAACELLTAESHLDGDDHKEHAHEDEHAHEEEHAHEDEHAHEEEHQEAEQHTAFHAEYAFNCANPAQLKHMEFPYFQIFPQALELEVQIVNHSGARAFEVERAEPQLEF